MSQSQVAVAAPALNVRLPTPARSRAPAAGLSVRSLWLVVGVLIVFMWGVTRLKLFTPGSDFGYYIGLIGAVMMLLLLLYPLRKHVRLLHHAGALRMWFRLHMVFGIAGPLLVLLHSNFELGSVNAAVALFSMLIVAGSGIVGRFIYTKIHHGLYGRHATLQEHQTRLGLTSSEVKSKFHFAPGTEARLKAFETYASAPLPGVFSNTLRFLTAGVRARWVYWRASHEFKRSLTRVAEQRAWDADKFARRLRTGRGLLADYLHIAQDVAQFRTYERLFSLWHILHVPFVFMLVISGVAHVIAVHMY